MGYQVRWREPREDVRRHRIRPGIPLSDIPSRRSYRPSADTPSSPGP